MFRENRDFGRITVEPIEKMESDTYYFSYTYRKNAYVHLPLSHVVGKVISQEPGISLIESEIRFHKLFISILIGGLTFAVDFGFSHSHVQLRAFIIDLIAAGVGWIAEKIYNLERMDNGREFIRIFGLLELEDSPEKLGEMANRSIGSV